MNTTDLRDTLLDFNCEAFRALRELAHTPQAEMPECPDDEESAVAFEDWFEKVKLNRSVLHNLPMKPISDAVTLLHDSGNDLTIVDAVVQRCYVKFFFEVRSQLSSSPVAKFAYEALITRAMSVLSALVVVPSPLYDSVDVNRFRLMSLARREHRALTQAEQDELADYLAQD